MQRGAKRISNSHRREIDNIKSNIRCSVRPFDGDGYPFKQALKELRDEGMNITYVRDKCHYVKS
ncbi:hypothetical protein HB762_27205 (plasmid) [Vibrio campbellii]|uniref:Transposase n=1 Tax=Vibrio campbellii TaxID=680 RepID=A0ABY5ILA9_9VIBR|nr:hypothetical protein [Vibrio campbellii]UTZ34954.1 hypothetical protein HB762_27205 [Vibrio campbellii]